ncbi:ABC transporter permease [Lentilactobacillus fungorum]|uniref:ABC transporter permease n=1 Tax=Lentilactobacillus fungorum TaxID=2201250 RepID=A0ABQ3W0B8_9LACO|nr:ABC transporter permease [Lentilactobacillus fungorum]GHP14039.1 ABC transporter permease [Lentilactobacillus fungorum]
MKKALQKNIRREFKFSLARFLSVTTLIALGVIVLIGLKVTGPDMRRTANNYYTEQKMADAVVTSNTDISKSDQNYLKSLPHVKKIEFGTYQDAVIENTNKSIRLNTKSTSLSKSKVFKGKLPTNNHEIALDKREMSKYKIGDSLWLVNNKGGHKIDNLKRASYKIVGFVTSPDYLKKVNMGQTSAGNGQISTYGIVTKSAFTTTQPKIAKISYNNVHGASYSNQYEQQVQDNVNDVDNKIRDRGVTRTNNEKQSSLDKLKTAENNLNHQQSQLKTKKAQLKAKQQQLTSQAQQASAASTQAQAQLRSAENTIKKNLAQISSAQAKINRAQKNLQDKRQAIQNNDQQIVYTIKSRNDYNTGYNQFGEDAKRIDSLSNTFPIIFFLVALLVCFTTMSRMAGQKRIELGTLRALGYTKFDTLKVFIIYGLSTGILGSLIGVLFGTGFLPRRIFAAYAANFSIPNFQTPLDPFWITLSTVISIAVTTLPALYAAGISLRELPATLMLPKPPKAGAKVLLEKIPFIWRHLSFNYKIMIRNLARYKTRMAMTIIGVAGCTALLITGFGIRDSLNGILSTQYQKIVHYDVISIYNPDASSSKLAAYDDSIDNQSGIKSKTKVFYEQVTTHPKDDINNQTITMLVPKHPDHFSSYVSLRNPQTHQKLSLPKNGIAMTKKLATLTGKKVGDQITIKDANGKNHQVKIGKIVEMYAGHNIYLTPSYYKQIFNQSANYNANMIKLNNRSAKNIDQVSKNLNKPDASVTAVQSDDEKTEINNILHGLNNLVLIITLCASALAFVVLFTLTNINVSERIRELSTIKVLGFYPMEVVLYVYRETFFLTAVGILFGWWGGDYLHRYIMQTLPPATAMTTLNLLWTNPTISAILTIIFSVIVMILMARKINRIDMLEALKSVD